MIHLLPESRNKFTCCPKKGFPPGPPTATWPIFLLNPNLSTIWRATRETCIKSFDAPVVTFSLPKITSSATLAS